MFILKFILILISSSIVLSFDLNDKLVSSLFSSNSNPSPKLTQSQIPNIASRLGESVLLECGANEHELLKQLESSVPSMPVLVNWFKHYSLTRRSDKPIYAKYLANNIDYAPHISRDYENRLQIVNKINLNISNLKAIDEALYECRLILFDKAYADSQVGSMFYLQVHVAPEFEYPNEEIVYFKPNVPIRLYCYTRGKPTPSIKWYKNGKQLDANTSVLQETFSMQENMDIFEYKCKAENIVGQIEHTVKVIRSGSLFFTEPLKNLTVTEGTILNWPCLAQSNAEITYKWFKDSIEVQSHLHKWSDRGALFQDGMLYLLETFRNDSGLYECHAFTANKRIETSAYLNVLYGPEIVPFPSPFYAYESSSSIVIDCVVKSNPNVIAIEWFKDKYLLSNTNKYQILSNNSLMIKNVQKADRGNYYCSCNNTIKKAVSQIVRIEIIDSKKVDILTFYSSSSQDSFKLPCKALLPLYSGVSTEQIENLITHDNVKWFKLNSKLPQNRYSIDSNGSLILNSLRSSDSGFYLCKLEDVYINNNRTKNTIQYTIDRSLSGNEKLIKLNVVQNKTTIDQVSNDLNQAETLINAELPLCPDKIEINQNKNGIEVKWAYPNNTQIKIEYFQIYYRESNNDKQNGENKKLSLNYEWKTTESINSNINSYLIDDSDLTEDKFYEIQLVSFSSFSKSLPSQPITLRYKPFHVVEKNYAKINLDHLSTFNQSISFNNLLNLSQLDFVLIAIFLILIFVLIICIIACIFYKQSSKNCKKNKILKKDLDDWGFQSSSPATDTFLSSTSSSASSSEKSLDSFNLKNKIIRNPTVDCDLAIKLNKEKLKSYNKKQDDLTYNKTEIKKININEEDDLFDDNDYYYSKVKDHTNTTLSRNDNSKYRNPSSTSNSTTTGVSTNINSASSSSTTDACNSSSNTSHSPTILIDSSAASSSGITSVSATSSLINSDDNHDDSLDKINDESYIPINTIKYNAKTNILQTQSNNHSNQQKKQAYSNKSKSNQIKSYTKLSPNLKNSDQNSYFFDLNEYSGVSVDVDSSLTNKIANNRQQWLNDDLATPASSSNYSNNCSVHNSPYLNENKINNHNKQNLPFPTNHFANLNSSSSLTIVSKLPTNSYSHLNNLNNENEIRYNKSHCSSETSSSSSGCSSIEPQNSQYSNRRYYATITTNNYKNKKNVNFVNQRNSLCSNLPPVRVSSDKKYQSYSAYKPVVKSSLLNVAKINGSLNSKNELKNATLTSSKASTNTNISSFRPSNKIDYV